MSKIPTYQAIPIGLIRDYIRTGTSGSFSIPDDPSLRLAIESTHKVITLSSLATHRIPDISDLQRVSFRERLDGDKVWHDLTVELGADSEEIYWLLMSVVDRVRIDGEAFCDAVESVLTSFARVLEKRPKLSRSKEVGLIGELLALRALGSATGMAHALASWRGPLGEEHDFGNAHWDLEIKTTTEERRVHWISSSTQLKASPLLPLFLLSIQITKAAEGEGVSLPELVQSTSLLVRNSAQLLTLVRAAGYSIDMSDLFDDRWAVRTVPAFYEVTPAFPAITQEHLDAVAPAPERVMDFRYRLDLTGLAESPALFEFDDVIASVNGGMYAS